MRHPDTNPNPDTTTPTRARRGACCRWALRGVEPCARCKARALVRYQAPATRTVRLATTHGNLHPSWLGAFVADRAHDTIERLTGWATSEPYGTNLDTARLYARSVGAFPRNFAGSLAIGTPSCNGDNGDAGEPAYQASEGSYAALAAWSDYERASEAAHLAHLANVRAPSSMRRRDADRRLVGVLGSHGGTMPCVAPLVCCTVASDTASTIGRPRAHCGVGAPMIGAWLVTQGKRRKARACVAPWAKVCRVPSVDGDDASEKRSLSPLTARELAASSWVSGRISPDRVSSFERAQECLAWALATSAERADRLAHEPTHQPMDAAQVRAYLRKAYAEGSALTWRPTFAAAPTVPEGVTIVDLSSLEGTDHDPSEASDVVGFVSI
jgi:hypothetical protein